MPVRCPTAGSSGSVWVPLGRGPRTLLFSPNVGFGPGPCGYSRKSLCFPLPASRGPEPLPQGPQWLRRSRKPPPLSRDPARAARGDVSSGGPGFCRVGSPLTFQGIDSVGFTGGVQNRFAKGPKRPWPWVEPMGTGKLQWSCGHLAGRGRLAVARRPTPGCEPGVALASLPFSTCSHKPHTPYTLRASPNAQCTLTFTQTGRGSLSYRCTCYIETHARALHVPTHAARLGFCRAGCLGG